MKKNNSMKNYRLIISVSALFLFVLSCKKNRPDERVFARWKISEYYLDGQPAYDTIVKYFDGVEYEISKLNQSSSSGADAAIRVYGLGQESILRYSELDNDGLTFSFYDTKVQPPYCNPQSTSKGCFECSESWTYTFINDTQMEWKPSPGNNHPITHQHQLVFIRVN